MDEPFFEHPIPKAKKRKDSADQGALILDEGKGLSSDDQQYQMADTINRLRHHFEKPKGGRIAVKVINHLGDEVMKVFRV